MDTVLQESLARFYSSRIGDFSFVLPLCCIYWQFPVTRQSAVQERFADGAVPDGNICAESAAAGEGAAWAYALLAVAHGGLVLPAVLAPCQARPCVRRQQTYAQGKRRPFWKRYMHDKVHVPDITKAPSSKHFFTAAAGMRIGASAAYETAIPQLAIKVFMLKRCCKGQCAQPTYLQNMLEVMSMLFRSAVVPLSTTCTATLEKMGASCA